ncbi:MAG: phosphotransferase family protein, partial [Pseudomonadota bacterium]
MTADEKRLAEAFAAYAETRIDGASMARVVSLHRIHGGASRETYSIDLTYRQAGEDVTRGLILRRDPPDSLIDTERKIEFAAIRSMVHADLPVP